MIENAVKRKQLKPLKKEKQLVLKRSPRMGLINIQFSLQKNNQLVKVDRIKFSE